MPLSAVVSMSIAHFITLTPLFPTSSNQPAAIPSSLIIAAISHIGWLSLRKTKCYNFCMDPSIRSCIFRNAASWLPGASLTTGTPRDHDYSL